MIVALALACTSTTTLGMDPDTTPPRAEDTAHELPGDTSATDTAEPDDPADREKPTAPVQVVLECPGPLQLDVDIPCEGALSWPDGEPEAQGTVKVHIRGRSSSSFPKPQYKLEFIGDDLEPAPVELFGMGRESDWVLNGMWIDRAMIRNRFAWDLFNTLSRGVDRAPESVYAELTLDGEYQGLYLLDETIDRDGSRLDFAEDDGSGARFLVHADDEDGITSPLQYGRWALDYPGDATAAQRAGVAEHLGAWEDAIQGRGSPWDHMDLDSFVLFLLVEELMKNNDGYFLSHRVWRGDDAMLRMVPWDLDLTLGQPNYNDNWLSSGWIYYRSDLVADSADAELRQALAARWREGRAGELADEALLARMQALRDEMGDAADRNWERWDISTVDFYGYLTPIDDPEVEWAAIERWLPERTAWIDANIEDF